jgi:tagatose 1,6-diphosphate aldolase
MSLLRLFSPRVRFFSPGILRDAELELVQPSPAFAEQYLQSVHHPACAGEQDCAVSLTALRSYLKRHPGGIQYPDARRGRPPEYRFWMRLHPAAGPGQSLPPPIPIAGTISFRFINDENTLLYYGHIGYHVFPPARGHHYAERSSRLLMPLARRHGMKELWITTNPDNLPSRRTCERLGCEMVEIVDLPQGHPLWQRGERRKCRYRLDLA